MEHIFLVCIYDIHMLTYVPCSNTVPRFKLTIWGLFEMEGEWDIPREHLSELEVLYQFSRNSMRVVDILKQFFMFIPFMLLLVMNRTLCFFLGDVVFSKCPS